MFIVTGGGSGIGKAMAQALANRGNSVLIIGRREQLLVETAATNALIHYLCADVSTTAGCQQILSHVSTELIQGLIHNAGIIDPIAPMTEIDKLAWHKVMATNVDAPLFLTQMLLPQLTNGRVLNIGSAAAYFPVSGWAAYCVSKAALSMLTRCWQLEESAVAFSSVMPGIIDTDMQALIRHTSNMDKDKLDFFKELKTNNQLVTPETVARFLCWLLLDIDCAEFVSKEWDIYDIAHHKKWLEAPHSVPQLP